MRYVFWGVGVFLVMCLAWWCFQTPRHDRQWADDVARLLRASVDGPVVKLENVRHFEWRSETDYTTHWETQQIDLRGLASADLLLSYWMGPHIAHTLVSFGFDDGRYLTFSAEIRKEQGEAFSALKGFVRQYEAVLIAAPEDDIVQVRTSMRGEDVRLLRLNIPREQLPALFMAYLKRAGQIEQTPEFYNTLTSNCTTVVWDIARTIAPGLPLDWRVLASGHFDAYAFDQGGLTPGFSFEELRALGRITERARAWTAARQAGRVPDLSFSQAIRIGVPGADGERSAVLALNGLASPAGR